MKNFFLFLLFYIFIISCQPKPDAWEVFTKCASNDCIKEAIDVNRYEAHVKDNKCNPGKNINASNRCPLCHSDIPPGERGWFTHLVKDLCPKNKKKKVEGK